MSRVQKIATVRNNMLVYTHPCDACIFFDASNKWHPAKATTTYKVDVFKADDSQTMLIWNPESTGQKQVEVSKYNSLKRFIVLKCQLYKLKSTLTKRKNMPLDRSESWSGDETHILLRIQTKVCYLKFTNLFHSNLVFGSLMLCVRIDLQFSHSKVAEFGR